MLFIFLRRLSDLESMLEQDDEKKTAAAAPQ
jgi:hypothetical protein